MSLADLLLNSGAAVDGEDSEEEEVEEALQPQLPDSAADIAPLLTHSVVDGEEEETEEEIEEENLPDAVAKVAHHPVPSRKKETARYLKAQFSSRTERVAAQKNERIRKSLATLFATGLQSFIRDVKSFAVALDGSLGIAQVFSFVLHKDMSNNLREFNENLQELSVKLEVSSGFLELNSET